MKLYIILLLITLIPPSVISFAYYYGVKYKNNTCIIEMKDSIIPGMNCEIKNEGRCVYYKDRGTKSYICGEFKLYIQEDK